MINTYAYVSENHQEWDVLHKIVPSYLKALTGKETNNVVFVHKLGERPTKVRKDGNGFLVDNNESPEAKSNVKDGGTISLSPKTSPHMKTERNKSNEILEVESNNDVTPVGSPLRDDCDISQLVISPFKMVTFNPWDDAEECYNGIPIKEAQKILQGILDQNVMKNDRGSVCILTDGNDHKKTLFLELESETSWFTRGVTTLKGIGTLKDLNMAKLLEEQEILIRNPIKIDVQTEIYYTFYNRTTLKFTHSGENEIKPSSFLQNNRCTLYQIFNIKDNSSIASEFLSQIFMLNELFEDIVRFKEDYNEESGSKQEPDYKRSSGIDMELLNRQVMKILCSVPEFQTTVETDRKSLLEESIDKAKQRQLSDTTDQLWAILQYCGSFKDLKAALTAIFQISAKYNVINMPKSDTKLGELIRDIAEHRIAIPVLIGSQPLELLLEIGMEKIFHDYEYIFQESRLYGGSDLKVNRKENETSQTILNVRKSLINAATKKTPDPVEKQRKTLLHDTSPSIADESIIGLQNSRFNEAEIRQKLDRLLQIQLILEHLIIIQMNLGINTVQAFVAKQMLQQEPIKFKKVLKERLNKLELEVVDDKLKDLIENKWPSAKRTSIVSENKFKKLQMVHYLNVDSIFPTNVFGNLFRLNPINEKQNIVLDVGKYWHIQYTKISSRLG